jgi:hypothetical protein
MPDYQDEHNDLSADLVVRGDEVLRSDVHQMRDAMGVLATRVEALTDGLKQVNDLRRQTNDIQQVSAQALKVSAQALKDSGTAIESSREALERAVASIPRAEAVAQAAELDKRVTRRTRGYALLAFVTALLALAIVAVAGGLVLDHDHAATVQVCRTRVATSAATLPIYRSVLGSSTTEPELHKLVTALITSAEKNSRIRCG